MLPDEDVAWVRIAMDKSRDKDLVGKHIDHRFHDLLRTQVHLLQSCLVGRLASTDPLRNHDLFGAVLLEGLGDIDLVSEFWIRLKIFITEL
jgi:hypothetical protein